MWAKSVTGGGEQTWMKKKASNHIGAQHVQGGHPFQRQGLVNAEPKTKTTMPEMSGIIGSLRVSSHDTVGTTAVAIAEQASGDEDRPAEFR